MSSEFARRFLSAIEGDWGPAPVGRAKLGDAFIALKMWLWQLYGDELITREQFRVARESLEGLMSLPGGPRDDLVSALDDATKKLHDDES